MINHEKGKILNRFTHRRFYKSLIFSIICLSSAILSGCGYPHYVLVDNVEKTNFLPAPLHPLDKPFGSDKEIVLASEPQIRVDKAVREFNAKHFGSPILVVDRPCLESSSCEIYNDTYAKKGLLIDGSEGRVFASFFRSDGMQLNNIELAKLLYEQKLSSLNRDNATYDEALPLLMGAGGTVAGAGVGAIAATEICEGFILLCIPMVGVGAAVGGIGGIVEGAEESKRRKKANVVAKPESNKQYWALLRWALSNDEIKKALADEGYDHVAFNFSFPGIKDCIQTSVEEGRYESSSHESGGTLNDALTANSLNPYEVCIGHRIPHSRKVPHHGWQMRQIKTHWTWNDFAIPYKQNSKVLVKIKATSRLAQCDENETKIQLFTDEFESIKPLFHKTVCRSAQPVNSSDKVLDHNSGNDGLISYFLLDLQSENNCVAFLGQVGDEASNKILQFPIYLPRFSKEYLISGISSEFCQRTVDLPTVDEVPIPEILYQLPTDQFLNTASWEYLSYKDLVKFLPNSWCLEDAEGVIDYSDCGFHNNEHYLNGWKQPYIVRDECRAPLDVLNDSCSRWTLHFHRGFREAAIVGGHGWNTGIIHAWYARELLGPLRPGAWTIDSRRFFARDTPEVRYAKFPDGRVGVISHNVDTKLPKELKVTFKDPYDFVVPGSEWRTESAKIQPINLQIE